MCKICTLLHRFVVQVACCYFSCGVFVSRLVLSVVLLYLKKVGFHDFSSFIIIDFFVRASNVCTFFRRNFLDGFLKIFFFWDSNFCSAPKLVCCQCFCEKKLRLQSCAKECIVEISARAFTRTITCKIWLRYSLYLQFLKIVRPTSQPASLSSVFEDSPVYRRRRRERALSSLPDRAVQQPSRAQSTHNSAAPAGCSARPRSRSWRANSAWTITWRACGRTYAQLTFDLCRIEYFNDPL